MRTWMITGVSSGFGYELCKQLLRRGERVVGTVRRMNSVEELKKEYPDTFDCRILDVRDEAAIAEVTNDVIETYGSIDVLINNAGYGLFGAVEELSDAQIHEILETNLLGSIQMIRGVLPAMRMHAKGRIIQISSYGGQVAFASNSMYHATKWGIEGFCEALAQEVARFDIGVTIVEPGGARTQFRYGSAKVAQLMEEYASCHGFLKMLDASNGLAPGDPAKMAARIIDSVDQQPAPLRMVLGSQALDTTIGVLSRRIAAFKAQKKLAASTDIEE